MSEERTADVLEDMRREYRSKAEDAAQAAERLAADMRSFASEVRARARGEESVFSTLGVVQSRGTDIDRRVGELAALETALVRVRWALERVDEPLV